MICARNRDVLEAAARRDRETDRRGRSRHDGRRLAIGGHHRRLERCPERIRPRRYRRHQRRRSAGGRLRDARLGRVATRRRSDAAECRGADARRAARNAPAAMGTRHPHHVDRRQAAGRQFDSLEQHSRRGHRLLAHARQRGGGRWRDGEHARSRLHAYRAGRRAGQSRTRRKRAPRPRRSWRASSGRFQCIASPSRASSPLSPRSSRRSGRATSLASRSSSTGVGSDR